MAMEDQLPSFLLKTYMRVEDPTTDDIVSWNIHGTGFVVWRPTEFARDILPTIFEHSNFTRFVRQLHTYEFHKVSPDRLEFENKNFRKGAIDQLHKVRRKNSTPNKHQCGAQLQKESSAFQSSVNERQRLLPSASTQYTILVDENKKLQQEKEALNSELSGAKKKLDILLGLASVYVQTL